MMEVYKIVIEGDDGYKTLFHGIDGSRTLPFDVWLKADKKIVIDGSGGTPYLSGIHCFLNRKATEIYLKRFRTKKNRVIIKCKAKGLRLKPTGGIPVFLADEIFIPSQKC